MLLLMCGKPCDLCVLCSKTVKECHKVIFCKTCYGYVHKIPLFSIDL